MEEPCDDPGICDLSLFHFICTKAGLVNAPSSLFLIFLNLQLRKLWLQAEVYVPTQLSMECKLAI